MSLPSDMTSQPTTATDTNPAAAQGPTLDALRNLTTIPVWSDDPDQITAATVLGCGRAKAYALARNGGIPVIRLGAEGTSVRVPVPALLRMLGAES